MAVYTEKVRSRASALLFGGLASVIGIVSGLGFFEGLAGDPVGLAVGSVGLVASLGLAAWGVVTAVLRIEVTRKAVRAQLGFQDVEIPLSAITHVTLESFGLNARRTMSTAPNQQSTMLIPNKNLVRVEWREDDQPRVHYIGSEYPDQLLSAIESALPPKVRVRVVEEEPETETAGESLEQEEQHARKAVVE